MSIFEGAGVALVTPFHEDGSVNYEKLERIKEQIAGGTDCYRLRYDRRGGYIKP